MTLSLTPRPLRTAVTGLAATYPLGGVCWDYMKYPLGVHRLGHDVLYVEDTGNWCHDPEAQTFVESGHRTADLFIHVSASCWMRDEYFAAARVAFVDIPTGPFDWIPTRQPVVLDGFRDAALPVSGERRALTTVGSWQPRESGPVVDGIRYLGKSTEFLRFIDLPRHLALAVEVVISGRFPTEEVRAHGWTLIDPAAVSCDPWTYRRFLASSLGEWSVAKNASVASRSGWFSCDTGFSRFLPVSEGLLPFATLESATEAVARLIAEPDRHAAAARCIAQECFDSDKVLTQLIDRALA